MQEFGTMADFDTMLAGIKQRHMRLIIDLVANHTSDEHHWFVESRKSKDNPYRDYYIWRPGKTGPDGNGAPAQQLPFLLCRLRLAERSHDEGVLPALLRREAAGPQLGQSEGARRSL